MQVNFLSQRKRALLQYGFKIECVGRMWAVYDPIDIEGFRVEGQSEEEVVNEAYEHIVFALD